MIHTCSALWEIIKHVCVKTVDLDIMISFIGVGEKLNVCVVFMLRTWEFVLNLLLLLAINKRTENISYG